MPMPSVGRRRHGPSPLDFNWGSSALIQSNGDEELIVDAETRETRLTLRRALGERFALQASVPYRYVGPGSLDSFIDDWHDAFGLPEGARPALPQDRFMLAYERAGAALLDEYEGTKGSAKRRSSSGIRIRAMQPRSAHGSASSCPPATTRSSATTARTYR